MRILPTNKKLFKYNLKETNLCDFCKSQIETTDHLFWECQHVQHLWCQLQNYLRDKEINYTLSKSEAYLGTYTHVKSDIINFITLLMKYYIFSCKYKETEPTFTVFKNYLSLRIKIEGEIAFSRDKYDSHLKKWQHF